MTKIIAIDFETANEQRGSACSVGLAWIENGAVSRVEERLIRPKEMRFSGFNISIHGITPEDVALMPEFPEVMDEFADDFVDATLLAHNAAFDMSVLRAGFDDYNLSYPEFRYLCTLKMVQKVWTELSNHKLSTVADSMGIEFQHHRASEDAEVCGKIALNIAHDLGVQCVTEIPKHIGMSPGRVHKGGYDPCSCRGTGLRKNRIHRDRFKRQALR